MLVVEGSSAVLHLLWIIIFVHFLTHSAYLHFLYCFSDKVWLSPQMSYELKFHNTPYNEQKKPMLAAQ